MPVTTKLSLTDNLPLTCSRSGTCCHGKMVNLNPWELACLAEAKEMPPRQFRDQYCESGGIRLRFDGRPGWKGLPACSLYRPDFGCSAHPGRPLVCRLYPLGRQKQNEEQFYIYQGHEFPCLEGCPEVDGLPRMTVADYITGQAVRSFEAAQDEYLEVMQNLADGAFVLLLESGLAESDDRKTLRLWRQMGSEEPQQLAQRLGNRWIDRLMLPDPADSIADPVSFSRRHYDLLLSEAEESFGTMEDLPAYSEASGLMMGLALHLGRGLGTDPSELAEHWINTAKKHGARD
ncbi:MAG: YkgJ family cysteine cluster protein [Spirochaetaceae bacterium]|nr:YkgJ family cysteine cluster protein [Spirochaetaceae bacterium]